MLIIADIYQTLTQHPALVDIVTLTALLRFFSITASLRNDIILAQPAKYSPDLPPLFLPDGIVSLLCQVTELPKEAILILWNQFKTVSWDQKLIAELTSTPDGLFQAAGHNSALAFNTFFPPSHYCTDTACNNTNALKKSYRRKVVLYTLKDGSVHAYAVQLYCPYCRTNYHHNYRVQNGRRVYYGGVPNVLEIGEHQYVERRLVDLWISSMVHAWTSATNCARLYNEALSNATSDEGFAFSPFLRQNQVWDAFIILALLEDYHARDVYLDVSQTADQSDRFLDAMNERNVRIQRYGQSELRHKCWKCVRYFDERAQGNGIFKVAVVVIDGVTIGHPCCSVHNCQVPLVNQQHRFCPEHSQLRNVCAIVGCNSPVSRPTKVCQDPTHIEAWQRHCDRGQSRFLLQQRLDHSRQLRAGNTERHRWNEEAGEEVFLINEQLRIAQEDSTDSTTNKRLRAQFGRRRTHNEQIIVCPCGVIIARTTFYGSEAVTSVVDFIERTFSHRPPPDHIFFDNNCTLAKNVKNNEFFKSIGLSVDVFHFKCKHSTSDTFCQENCNPRAFPELIRPDGGWYFNSSVAEQTNVWLGGYHSICKEMRADKYNFFLDEMIARRNVGTVQTLDSQGYLPSYWDI